MIKNLTITLSLCMSIYSGFCFSGKETRGWMLETPIGERRLTEEQLSEAFDAGIHAGASYMIVVLDSWDYGFCLEYVIYCYEGDDACALINQISTYPSHKITAVYSMELDFHEQLTCHSWNVVCPLGN